MKEFDHPGFLIPNQQGLKLVVTAIRLALHGKFPVEELYKPWQNSEGQVCSIMLLPLLLLTAFFGILMWLCLLVALLVCLCTE